MSADYAVSVAQIRGISGRFHTRLAVNALRTGKTLPNRRRRDLVKSWSAV
jgi:hypothetical protein